MAENSTVLPGDSVSRPGSPASLGTAADTDVSVVVAQLLGGLPAAYESMDRVAYNQYAVIVSDFVKGVSGGVNVRCGALRVASRGSSAAGSSTGSSGGSSAVGSRGGSGARAAALRGLKSWRPSKVPDGLCYSKLLKGTSVEAVVSTLGEWPALSAVLKVQASHFQSLEELERFRYTGDSSSVHVLAGGLQGYPLLPAVAKFVQGTVCTPGTFGALVRAAGLSTKSCGPQLSSRTFVGGLSSSSACDLNRFDSSVAVSPVDMGEYTPVHADALPGKLLLRTHLGSVGSLPANKFLRYRAVVSSSSVKCPVSVVPSVDSLGVLQPGGAVLLAGRVSLNDVFRVMAKFSHVDWIGSDADFSVLVTHLRSSGLRCDGSVFDLTATKLGTSSFVRPDFVSSMAGLVGYTDVASYDTLAGYEGSGRVPSHGACYWGVIPAVGSLSSQSFEVARAVAEYPGTKLLSVHLTLSGDVCVVFYCCHSFVTEVLQACGVGTEFGVIGDGERGDRVVVSASSPGYSPSASTTVAGLILPKGSFPDYMLPLSGSASLSVRVIGAANQRYDRCVVMGDSSSVTGFVSFLREHENVSDTVF